VSTAIEEPANVVELAHYVIDEHPHLEPAYNAGIGQLLLVGQPGKPEPPAALREMLGCKQFEVQGQQVTGRDRWIALVNRADGGYR
jgi:hypothetical protein